MNPTKMEVERLIRQHETGLGCSDGVAEDTITCLRALPQIIAERDRALRALEMACADEREPIPLNPFGTYLEDAPHDVEHYLAQAEQGVPNGPHA